MNPRAAEYAGQFPLSKKQIRALILDVIKPAFADLRKRGALSDAEDFDSWRYEETWKACGKESLRACVQADYALICEHFATMRGNVAEAVKWGVRAATNEERIARHLLQKAILWASPILGDAWAYADAIARRKYKGPIESLTARQLQCLMYDVRRGAQKKLAKRGGVE